MPSYQFRCGCVYPVSEIKALQPQRGKRFVCPEHSEYMSHVIAVRKTCGKEFNAKHPNAAFCKECAGEAKKRAELAYRTHRRPAKNEALSRKCLKYFPRKSDCKEYFNCISIPGGALLTDSRACETCTKYEKRDTRDDVLAHITAGDSITAQI